MQKIRNLLLRNLLLEGDIGNIFNVDLTFRPKFMYRPQSNSATCYSSRSRVLMLKNALLLSVLLWSSISYAKINYHGDFHDLDFVQVSNGSDIRTPGVQVLRYPNPQTRLVM